MLKRTTTLVALACLPLISAKNAAHNYPLHHDITATEFWVGEEADASNHNIDNIASAWDEHWATHFGGVDDPKHRKGDRPAKFVPKENPFYFALPYNDFDNKGEHRKDVAKVIPWYDEHAWTASESICKNRWIRIKNGEKTCYAQWEDVGPFSEDDQAYVFGTATPKNADNDHAGLDLSPAVTTFLNLNGEQKVDWAFVDGDDVPQGPWTAIKTTSQTDWK